MQGCVDMKSLLVCFWQPNLKAWWDLQGVSIKTGFKHSIATYILHLLSLSVKPFSEYCSFVWILPYTAVTDCTTNSCLNIENVTESHRVEYLGRNAGVLPVSGSNSSIKEGSSAAPSWKLHTCACTYMYFLDCYQLCW